MCSRLAGEVDELRTSHAREQRREPRRSDSLEAGAVEREVVEGGGGEAGGLVFGRLRSARPPGRGEHPGGSQDAGALFMVVTMTAIAW
ncbi:hypothetical protein ACKI1J_01730 [Streptomyces scabiei]|uniref:hypothetical protein n=1 Tax=Streptomyces scabiei TaxID=1930 RepID=UPI0038F64CF7